MTMPDERTRSVMWTRQLLSEIRRDDKLPEQLRMRAEQLLRHFPADDELDLAARVMPEWWAKPSDVPE